MNPDDDEKLRAALAEAHRGDAARTPPFERAWARAGRSGGQSHSALPWLATCASLAAALGLSAWLVDRLGPPPAQLPTGTRWIGPTDFLLETPGLVTLRTVPALAPSLAEPTLGPQQRALRGIP